MSLDQIIFHLVDRKQMSTRQKEMPAENVAASLADKDGLVKVRTSDGKLIKVPVAGKSLARRMIEAEEAKRQPAQPKPQRPRGRR